MRFRPVPRPQLLHAKHAAAQILHQFEALRWCDLELSLLLLKRLHGSLVAEEGWHSGEAEERKAMACKLSMDAPSTYSEQADASERFLGKDDWEHR